MFQYMVEHVQLPWDSAVICLVYFKLPGKVVGKLILSSQQKNALLRKLGIVGDGCMLFLSSHTKVKVQPPWGAAHLSSLVRDTGRGNIFLCHRCQSWLNPPEGSEHWICADPSGNSTNSPWWAARATEILLFELVCLEYLQPYFRGHMKFCVIFAWGCISLVIRPMQELSCWMVNPTDLTH